MKDCVDKGRKGGRKESFQKGKEGREGEGGNGNEGLLMRQNQCEERTCARACGTNNRMSRKKKGFPSSLDRLCNLLCLLMFEMVTEFRGK